MQAWPILLAASGLLGDEFDRGLDDVVGIHIGLLAVDHLQRRLDTVHRLLAGGLIEGGEHAAIGQAEARDGVLRGEGDPFERDADEAFSLLAQLLVGSTAEPAVLDALQRDLLPLLFDAARELRPLM